ncbi:MAG: prephenate dehydratase domain-containing protein, partial [Rikenellaceae bacterium]
MKISIQGYEGSFHQIAAEKYFGGEIEIVPCATFREVTLAVEKGSVNAGIMAIENSIAGSILPNYALLQNPSLTVTGEVYLSIEQNLLGVKGASIADIKEVESHPMALLQCLNFLEDNIKGVRMVESADTALSAKDVALRGDKSVAAIASRRAAELFGLEILAPNINTVKVNYTRFLVIEQSDK